MLMVHKPKMGGVVGLDVMTGFVQDSRGSREEICPHSYILPFDPLAVMETVVDFGDVDEEIRTALLDTLRESSALLPSPLAKVVMSCLIPTFDLLLYSVNNAVALLGPVSMSVELPSSTFLALRWHHVASHSVCLRLMVSRYGAVLPPQGWGDTGGCPHTLHALDWP
jgi:hypothetical protein